MRRASRLRIWERVRGTRRFALRTSYFALLRYSAAMPSERKTITVLCLIAALRVFVFSAGFPFFNNVDEDAHFDLVLKYSQRHLPRSLETVSADAAQFMGLFGTTEYFAPRPRKDLPGLPAPAAAALDVAARTDRTIAAAQRAGAEFAHQPRMLQPAAVLRRRRLVDESGRSLRPRRRAAAVLDPLPQRLPRRGARLDRLHRGADRLSGPAVAPDRRPAAARVFSAGHFLLDSKRRAVAALLRRDVCVPLGAMVPRRRPPPTAGGGWPASRSRAAGS